MSKEKKHQPTAQLWADLRTSVDDLLHSGTPKEHIQLLTLLYETYLDSENANDLRERQSVMSFYAAFKSLLKTLKRHHADPFNLPPLVLAGASGKPA